MNYWSRTRARPGELTQSVSLTDCRWWRSNRQYLARGKIPGTCGTADSEDPAGAGWISLRSATRRAHLVRLYVSLAGLTCLRVGGIGHLLDAGCGLLGLMGELLHLRGSAMSCASRADLFDYCRHRQPSESMFINDIRADMGATVCRGWSDRDVNRTRRTGATRDACIILAYGQKRPLDSW